MRIISIVLMALMVHPAAFAQDFSCLTNRNHPRLLMDDTDLSSITEALQASDKKAVKKLDSLIIHLADSIVSNGEKIEYKLDVSDKRILLQSRRALESIFFCSYAYRRTGNVAYLNKAIMDLKDACSFPDWNPSHFLDTGEMAAAVGIGYDWLYQELNQDDKETICESLIEKAFKPACDEDKNWFYYNEGNWNQVCNAGLTVAALAIYEECCGTAQDIIEESIRTNMNALEKIYGNDGNYAEGPGYWLYGTMFQILMISSLETALGSDFGLSDNVGFGKTAAYILLSEGAVHKTFNYSDNVSHVAPNYPLWYFANKFSDSSLLFSEIKHLNERGYESSDCRRLLPLLVPYALKIGESAVKAPEIHYFAGNGTTPVMMYRGDWSNTEKDVFLGFKGGTPNSTHSHMDGGSFIFDFNGVRWSMDLDRQDYGSLETPVKEIGGDIWDLSQSSYRWKLFRINNRQHSTLTINDHDHNIKGKARLTQTVDTEDSHGATMDLSELFSGDLLSASRELTFVEGKGLVIKDSIETPQGRSALVRWTMVTPADPEITENGIILRSGSKAMLLKASCQEGRIIYKLWSTDPKAYRSPTAHLEEPCPGTWLVGFETTVPKGKLATICTTLDEIVIEK